MGVASAFSAWGLSLIRIAAAIALCAAIGIADARPIEPTYAEEIRLLNDRILEFRVMKFCGYGLSASGLALAVSSFYVFSMGESERSPPDEDGDRGDNPYGATAGFMLIGGAALIPGGFVLAGIAGKRENLLRRRLKVLTLHGRPTPDGIRIGLSLSY